MNGIPRRIPVLPSMFRVPRLCLLVLWCAMAAPLCAQEEYAIAMEHLASGINSSIAFAEASTVLVSPFQRMDGQGCEVDEVLTGDLEAALLAKPRMYKLLDRTNLARIAEEHKLQLEGMMDDEQRFREAGKLLKADVMVFGSHRLVGDVLLLRVKAVDIQTSEQLAIVPAEALPSKIISGLCKGAPSPPLERKELKPAGTTDAQPKVVVPCKGDLGSYCFRNISEHEVKVAVPAFRPPTEVGMPGASSLLIVPPGKEECFYDKPPGVYPYSISGKQGGKAVTVLRQSNFRLEPCKTGVIEFP